jgi:anaerobic magnesium-protoporphyrin IX monomethyl ester cyclase
LKVALVNPPLLLPRAWGLPVVSQNLGLMYVASAFRSLGYEVKVIDAVAEQWRNYTQTESSYYSGLYFDQIINRLKNYNPDIVGVSSIYSVNASTVKKLVTQIKESLPSAKIMVGGADVTIRPKEYDMADYVVLGEGEETAKTISQKHIHNQCFIGDLDSLSFPARDLFPMEEYFAAYDAHRSYRNKYVCHRRWTTMIATRGCPFNCCFCSIHLSMGKKLRKRSIGNIEEEINLLVHGNLRIQHINFEDDNISLDRAYFREFLKMIRRYGVTWSLPNGIRADTLDEEIVQLMAKAGCQRLFVAPEVGVQKVLDDIVHKNLSLKAVEKAVVLFHKYGIHCDASFIIGFIGETKQDILATLRYAKKLRGLGLEDAAFNIASPLYGTDLYNQAVSLGLLKETDCGKMSPFESLISTDELNSEWLLKMREFARFYVNRTVHSKPIFIEPS